jgi:hypothetical protein
MRRLAQFLSSSKVVLDPTVAADENVFVLSPNDQINYSPNHYLPQQFEQSQIFFSRVPEMEKPSKAQPIALATLEKTVLELEPISRSVPTTIIRITATITAYSAMS